MWLFTKYGYLSVVNARLKPNRSSPVDLNKMIIRTRCKSHLENLCQAFGDLLKSNDINEDFNNERDYRFLMIVPKKVWLDLLDRLGNEMDYPKFKPSLIEFEGRDDYENLCLSVWQLGFDFQNAVHS